MFDYDGRVSASPVALAHRLIAEAVDALCDAAGAGASAEEMLSVLTLCEGVSRQLDRLTVDTIAGLARHGAFAERGYSSPARALNDLLGWESFESRRRVVAAEQVCSRVGLDGAVRPARLPATAAAFAAGRIGLRHVESVTRVLTSPAAARLTPEQWSGAEAELARRASEYTPHDLNIWGMALVEALDQDGAEPDDQPPPLVNELALTHHRGAPGGTLKGRFDDPALFDAIAAVIDAKARPLTSDDDRTPVRRNAEALAEVCGYVLDHGDVPACGGRRPHLNVIVRLDDLQNRARAAMLDFGGTLSPESLRMLACDAAVVPIVMNGTGQPLDVGRATRAVPDGLRRAVAARDLGCAHPGCNRPPSWCDCHHIKAWEDGGDTTLENLVMLCRAHHRQVHHTAWIVRIRDGLPEFIPPAWIDPEQKPRRRPLPHLGLVDEQTRWSSCARA